VDIDAQAASLATPGEWRVRRLAVANGPNIFQMLLVSLSEIVIVELLMIFIESTNLQNNYTAGRSVV